MADKEIRKKFMVDKELALYMFLYLVERVNMINKKA
jgi:hypothetical protein